MSDSFMVLSDKIVDMSAMTSISIDRMSLDITLSQAMTEENRADMLAFIDDPKPRSGTWVMAQVMHDIEGFKQEHLSDKSTGFVARTSGCAKKRPQIILFMSGGVLQGACSTIPDMEIRVADKDDVETEEDQEAYNNLVDISSGDDYTDIH